jgi:hypothetical protein
MNTGLNIIGTCLLKCLGHVSSSFARLTIYKRREGGVAELVVSPPTDLKGKGNIKNKGIKRGTHVRYDKTSPQAICPQFSSI